MIDRLNDALDARYRVEEQIGEGGMATVFLAADLKHNRKVALKVLKPELAAVVGAERFLGEIETTANLQHPHILPLFDSGEAGGFLYYVMPYVEGETLRDRLERERQLPVDEAVRIARAMAHALQAAHDQGVVHRDIKPANVLLSRGEPLVADFGVALAVGAAGGRLTETGLSVGTPYYMSPEQATGDESIGPATDIYALGCVLYEMLVGEPPYSGNTAQAVLARIISGQMTPPRTQRGSIPRNVDAAVRKAVERLPADRFTSADDFARVLADPGFRHGEEAGVAGQGPGLWYPVSLGLAGLAVVLASALVWSLSRSEPVARAPVARFVLDLDTGTGASTGSFALLPGGSGLVYSAPSSAGTLQLWVRHFEDLIPSPVPDTDGGFGPSVSPNGEEVVFLGRAGDVRVVPLAGGVGRRLGEAARCCPYWSRDGFIYFSRFGEGVRRVSAQGGAEEVVTEVESGAGEAHDDFYVLPGGEVAVFSVFVGSVPRIEALRLATGERAVLTPGLAPHVTSSGHLVFASLQGDLLAAPFDADALRLTGPAIPVVEGVIVDANLDAYYDLSESGTLAYQSGSSSVFEERDLVWVSRDGTESLIDPDWRATFWTPALSPDGTRLAVAVEGQGGRDLWIKELDRGPDFRLTFPEGHDHRPWWTPDGGELLFISERGETRDVYRRRADGLGDAELVLDLPDAVNQAFYSPDGEWLVYRTGRVNALDIFARRSTGDTTPVPIADSPAANEHSPTLSPDGRWLAYVSDESGRWELYVRPFPNIDDGRWVVSSSGATEPRWAPDGEGLLYKSAQNQLVATRVTGKADGTFTVGASDPLFPVDAFYGYDFSPQWDVAPDGERFLMIRLPERDGTSAPVVLVQNWISEIVGRGRTP